MPEENAKQKHPIEVIALPPLKMTLVYAKEERMNREMLKSITNDASKSVKQEDHVEPQTLMKIIEHLEKKS